MRKYVRYANDYFTQNRLGVVMIEEVEGGNFKIGVSICSPCDKFDRNYGKALAEERLKNSKSYTFYDVIDGRATEDIIKALPHGYVREIVDDAIFYMGKDILMDYAKDTYKRLKNS